MTVTQDKGELIIRIPLYAKPEASASAKSLVVASSHGNKQTTVQIGGQNVTVGVNAYIPNPSAPAK